jgi:hypothetical protein
MCFSAGASFTAGTLLTFAGTETLRKVHKPSQIVFASIPLFFAFQQFAEGVLWLVIAKKGHHGLETIATYFFLIMAQVLWPLIVPFSVLLMEDNKVRKRILRTLLAIGATVSLYYIYSLVFYRAHAEITRLHIGYQSNVQDSFSLIAVFLYLVATLFPFFISSIKRTSILGLIMCLSFLVSVVFYPDFMISVWCFFAAVISFFIFYTIRDAHKKFHLTN